jgi:hypothetical protein
MTHGRIPIRDDAETSQAGRRRATRAQAAGGVLLARRRGRRAVDRQVVDRAF